MTPPDAYAPLMERITRAEAAQRLGLSLSQLDTLARAGKLERRRNEETGRVYYDAGEVEALRRRRESVES